MDLGSQKKYTVHVYAIKQQFLIPFWAISDNYVYQKKKRSLANIDGFALVWESDKTILMNYVLIN